ncbi:MAG: hypothetical protein HKL83_05230 [Acidimicrobiaceae bacterium]|nr:hypothetical protein [Acidimicrobiaceae bacterium]
MHHSEDDQPGEKDRDPLWENLQIWTTDIELERAAKRHNSKSFELAKYASLTLAEKIQLASLTARPITFTMSSGRILSLPVWSISNDGVMCGPIEGNRIPTKILSFGWIRSINITPTPNTSHEVKMESNGTFLAWIESNLSSGTDIVVRTATSITPTPLIFLGVGEDHLIAKSADQELLFPKGSIAEIDVVVT